jgi:hypothetical protein
VGAHTFISNAVGLRFSQDALRLERRDPIKMRSNQDAIQSRQKEIKMQSTMPINLKVFLREQTYLLMYLPKRIN